jgi:hypothetical protein
MRRPRQPGTAPSTRKLRILGVLAAIAVPAVLSGASFTSSTRNPANTIGAAADWTPPTVEIVDPGDAIRGTVSITANAADAETRVVQVVLSYAPSGTTTWTTICTKTAAPYTCALNTSSLPEDDIDLRAVATDATGLSSTDVLEGVLVDNTAPSGSIGTVGSPLAGVVTIPATATDGGAGVASVAIQYAPSGLTSFTTICTDLDLPYSCRWDTTQVLLGAYDLRAVITDLAGNTATTNLVRNRLVNNTADSVSVEDPGSYVRGTVSILANASSVVGVQSVRLQRQAVGTSAWTDLCTDTASPYSCSWVTGTVPDGQYLLRAILTNSVGGSLTSATVGPVQVDNALVRGYDVQGSNGGAKVGRLEAGDTLSVTYTRPVQAASLLAGWSGSARSVVVRVRDGNLLGLGGSGETADVFTTTAYSTPVNLGSINLKANLLKNRKTVAFNATMTMTSTTVNGQPASTVTLVLGTVAAGGTGPLRTTSAKPAMVWTPSAAALDTTGVATSAAPVTELGPLDADV